MDAMVAVSCSVPRFEALVLLFHFGVSHLSSNVIAAPNFCSPRRALKIALRRSKKQLPLTTKTDKTPKDLFF
jgi:hypothetical protein